MPPGGAQYAPSRYQIEARESTDPARLDVLAHRKSSFVQSTVAKNPHTGAATLARLAEGDNQWARRAVAKHAHTLVETLTLLAGDPVSEVRVNVAYNPRTPADALALLSHDLDANVRAGAGWNKNTPSEALDRLTRDPAEHVRARVAKNRNTPDASLLPLVNDPSANVRSGLAARNFDPTAPTETVMRRRFNGRRTETEVVTRRVETGGRYPEEVIREFARSNDVKLQFRAAGQPDAPEDVLVYLAARAEVAYVLKIIAENRGASAAALRAVAQRKDTDSLKVVAVNPNTDDQTLTELALSGFRSVHVELAHRRAGGLQWLATHSDPKVRVVAAKQVGHYAGSIAATEAESTAMSLLADSDVEVQVAAAGAVPTALLDRLLLHETPRVRKVAAERAMSPETLARMATDDKAVVRRAVARNKHTPADALALLSSDTDAKVREFAAERFLSALGG
jgi:hypothetical protein